jgi:hypothetical protein
MTTKSQYAEARRKIKLSPREIELDKREKKLNNNIRKKELELIKLMAQRDKVVKRKKGLFR